MYTKIISLVVLFAVNTISVIAGDTLPDDELWTLCTNFKQGNSSRIKELIERPNYNINAEIDSQFCGGVTILHATYWWYRWIRDTEKRENARPILLDRLTLLLEHKANPHIMIQDCLVNDEVIPAQFQDSINSAYLHAKIASDQEVERLMTKFWQDKPHYPPITMTMYHAGQYICFDNEQSATDQKKVIRAQRLTLIEKAKIKQLEIS